MFKSEIYWKIFTEQNEIENVDKLSIIKEINVYLILMDTKNMALEAYNTILSTYHTER